MAESNLEVVQQLFDRYAQGGIEAAIHLIHEAVVIEIPPDMSAEPDTYLGHAGVRRYFAGFDGMLEDVRYEPVELVIAGEQVLAHAHLSGRGVSSGLDVGLDAYVVHDFADGRIVRLRPFPDRDSAEAALGSAG